MKFYLVTADIENHEETGTKSKWVVSQSDAAGARKELIEQGAKRKDLKTFELDIPTDKAGLLEFLNDYRNGPAVLVLTRKLTEK